MNNPIKTLINAMRAGLRKRNEHVAVGSNLDNPKERIQTLINAMHVGLHERDEHVAVILLAALSGQNIFLLGPPGTAKSLLARRLASVFGGECFEYLMQKFSTPEEIFGPVSIAELKNDKYVRKTKGFLPTADFAFLDEIWKAGQGILNTLLTIINEKKFRNGAEIEDVPLKAVISASNGTPSPNSGLDALYDRFVVRLYVSPVGDVNHFNQMLSEEPAGLEAKCGPISADELNEWRERIKTVKLSPETKDIIQIIRGELYKLSSEKPEEKAYVSDRRWQQAAILLKAGAFFCGRDSTNLADTMLLRHCLWTTNDNREAVIRIVEDAVKGRGFQSGKDTVRLEAEKDKIAKAIYNNLYRDKKDYKTFKLEGVDCYKAAVYSSVDSDPKTAEKTEFYMPIERRDNFHPASVGKNPRKIRELTCTFQKPGSYSVSSGNNYGNYWYLFEKINGALQSAEKVEIEPEGSIRKVPETPSDTIDRLAKSLKDDVDKIAADFDHAISVVEEKQEAFARAISTPFVPEKIQNVALEGIKSQLSDLRFQRSGCDRLLKRIARE